MTFPTEVVAIVHCKLHRLLPAIDGIRRAHDNFILARNCLVAGCYHGLCACHHGLPYIIGHTNNMGEYIRAQGYFPTRLTSL